MMTSVKCRLTVLWLISSVSGVWAYSTSPEIDNLFLYKFTRTAAPTGQSVEIS